MSHVDEIIKYYDALAPQYHRKSGYNDLSYTHSHADRFRELFNGRDVLEIACGTGYWTEIIAKTAKSILATDVNRSMVKQAKKRLSGVKNVEFKVSNAYSLVEIPSGFSGAFSVLWWCFMPKSKIKEFLKILHSKLKPDSIVSFMCQLADSDAGNHLHDSNGNMVAKRMIDNRYYNIVKNIPSEEELRDILAPISTDLKYSKYSEDGLWSVSYSIL
ncbi:MAG: class I SAM-dependent methyltransferase [Candidatus Aegiribacteria sp.]|nr:class I SAM-dependent methyltransferase [Candidatus Aegiribacteria sp.]